MSKRLKVCIVGAGRWGSVIAKIVGHNVMVHNIFIQHVTLWVHEEYFNGQLLSDIINTKHENTKYMPGCQIPYNVLAMPELDLAAEGADILIFVVPFNHAHSVCMSLQGHIKPSAIAVSLIKGFDLVDGEASLLSDMIRNKLDIECAVLMGANLASEVSIESYCEATIGCADPTKAAVLKKLFSTQYFRINTVPDERTVELCGALKEIVFLAALVCDGTGLIANTKAAIVRLGLNEMIRYCQLLHPETRTATFLESCGVADVITTAYNQHNQVTADAFIKCGGYQGIERMEKIHLGGQKLNGPPAAAAVHATLQAHDLASDFPVFTAIHDICKGTLEPNGLIERLRSHPAHI